MIEWSVVHRYRTLAEDGRVKFLSCPDDKQNLITIMGPIDEPALWCPACDSVMIIGLDLYDQIRAVVNEHTL